MAKSTLHALDDLSLLGFDSFVFLSNNADEHAQGGAAQVNGLDLAIDQARGNANGLELAVTAPIGTPADLEIPDHSSSDLPDLIGMSGITMLDSFLAAKGGGGGGGKPGGGGTGGDPSVLSSYTSQGDGDSSSDYNIEIAFKGSSWTSALQTAFKTAADYLSTIITDDIADVFFRGNVIDDIRIDAELKFIDGEGGILGQAGPTAYRTADFLPASAKMQFDIDDASYFDSLNLFDDIVLHEMLHSIGFGTMWDLMGLTSGSITGGDLQFTGSGAIAAYKDIFNFAPSDATGVPIETDGGSGTAGGHWDDATFLNELMTGYIGSPGNWQDQNYVSAMTVAALEDMGYQTLWDASIPAGGGTGWPADPIIG